MLLIRALMAIMVKMSVVDSNLFYALGELGADLSEELLKDVR
jgi:hypothetical protein